MRQHPLGIYEKALPKDLSWPERLVLAKSCGFDFVEMSVDETDERLSRLDWSTTQRASLVEAMLETGVAIPLCACLHTVASRLAAAMKPCANAPVRS
jgi:hexulose-6-phosphate isomerase